jgi:hypothetical protein
VRLLLTHLWPGSDRSAALAAAGEEYDGTLGMAATGLQIELG